MTGRDIIAIGGSAGAVEALSQIVAGLPPDLRAAVFVTIHFPPNGTSALPHILSRHGPLPASHARDGESIRRGHIYIAPPDHHMVIRPGLLRLVRGPTENGNRPAIDPMFRSAAVAYRNRVIGVVITGNLDDGTAGLLAIKRRGGLVVVQDPADALFPSMATSACDHVEVDAIAPLRELPALLTRLVDESRTEPMEDPVPDSAAQEVALAALDLHEIEDVAQHPGHPSPFGCPDCGGVLWQIADGDLVRYRCRVGHGWTADGLAGVQVRAFEAAMWSALRTLEESAQLNEQMAARARRRNREILAARFEANAAAARARAATIRQGLLAGLGGDRDIPNENAPMDRAAHE